ELPDCSIPRQRLQTVAELNAVVNLFFVFFLPTVVSVGLIGVEPSTLDVVIYSLCGRRWLQAG
ncbi:MAG: hypothetical protein KAG12_02865, partial [Desulfuromusa sp.]|nr:hypothetical protein [Desulfuromusa sp.]